MIEIIRAQEESLLDSFSPSVQTDFYAGGGDAKPYNPWDVMNWKDDTLMVKTSHQSLWD